MNLKHLHYFRTLAHNEHYTKAAEKLSITQPSLSHAISELEKELGTYLFEKKGRNIKLTKQGKFFLDYVEVALKELETGERNLKQMISPSTGTIDLGFIYTLGAHLVPSLMKDFLSIKDNENISFSLSQGATINIVSGLKSDKYDLVFSSFVENEPDIEFIPVFEEELVLIVNKNHPLAIFDEIDLIETKDYNYISFIKESGLYPVVNKIFRDLNINPNIICRVEEDSAIAGLVAIDYGIAILPKLWILDHFDVKTIKIKNKLDKRYIYLAYIKNRHLSPAVEKFKNFSILNRQIND